MSGAGYTRRAHRTVYENRWLRFEAHDIVHPNGRAGEHGLVVVPDASAVVALDGDDVILTRQARFAVDRIVLEVVKGGAAAGETHLAAAQRELREELGFVAARWDDLGDAYEIPSIVQQPVRLFLARTLTAVATDPEDIESIDAVRMPFAAALRAAGSGEIADAITVAALLRTAHVLATECATSTNHAAPSDHGTPGEGTATSKRPTPSDGSPLSP
jgi:ADP-ribose pyrophosphatase